MKLFLIKLISLVLITTMLAGVCIVNATPEIQKQSLQISYQSVLDLIKKVETELASKSANDRRQLYSFGKAFFTDDNLDDALDDKLLEDLLETVYYMDTTSDDNPLVKFLAPFTQQKKELLFALSLVKSIKLADRVEAFNRFTEKEPYNATSLNETARNALADIYDNLVGEAFQATLKTDHGITDMVMLGLFGCIRGNTERNFVLTDNSVTTSDFSIKSIDSDFSQRLSSNVSKYFSTINGESTNDGSNILRAIISAVNKGESNANIANYKTLFGAMGMYVKYTAPGGGGGSGTITYGDTTPVTSGKPLVIPTPSITIDSINAIKGFSDVTVSDWSAPYVSSLVSRKIFMGYEDGSFKPKQGITRQELAVALVRCLGLEARLDGASELQFTDNNEIGDWAKQAVALLVDMGIYKGYGDGSFQPQRVISREELSALIARSLTKTAHNVELDFVDKDEIGDWALDSIKKTYALGIIKGYEDKSFKPDNFISREEVVTILYNFLFTENLL